MVIIPRKQKFQLINIFGFVFYRRVTAFVSLVRLAECLLSEYAETLQRTPTGIISVTLIFNYSTQFFFHILPIFYVRSPFWKYILPLHCFPINCLVHA